MNIQPQGCPYLLQTIVDYSYGCDVIAISISPVGWSDHRMTVCIEHGSSVLGTSDFVCSLSVTDGESLSHCHVWLLHSFTFWERGGNFMVAFQDKLAPMRGPPRLLLNVVANVWQFLEQFLLHPPSYSPL